MKNRAAILTFFLLAACATCFGQSSFKGLTPGQSTRSDVERVFGQPVQSVSKTLIEYKSPENVGKVYIQYRDESPAARVERIELICDGVSGPNGCWELNEKLVRTEPQVKPLRDAFKTSGPDSSGLTKELTYFGFPALVARTLIKEENSSVVQDRIGLYSKELYESTVPKSCTGLFHGEWETNRGRLIITRTPAPPDGAPLSYVKGSYSTNNGAINGDVSYGGYPSELELQGEWKDDMGGGTMKLRIPERGGTTFTGTWNRTSGKGAKEGTWEGRCVETKRSVND